jgi:hypothetical protein
MKKGQSAVGIGIIAMAILLLLGGIFFEDGPALSKEDYFKEKNGGSGSGDSENGYLVDGFLQENFLFYLEDTEIGRQRKVTQSFPNIELGSEEEFNTVFRGNSFRLNANPFTSNDFSFTVQLSEPEDVQELLIYFVAERSGGEQELEIFAGNQLVSRNLALSSDIPIRLTLNDAQKSNISSVPLTFRMLKPSWYELFNWNSLDISEVRVIEIKRDQSNNLRDFDFHIDKDFLEDVLIDLSVSCTDTKDVSEAIKVSVNGFIISNTNPSCTTRARTISTNVSLNILNDGQNRLVLETDGFYKVAFGVTQVKFNDQEVYKFNVNDFSDIIDVVMYGDFDKEVIDLRINSQTLTLRRDEVKSIIPFLRFGVNEIRFLTKPLEIEEFVIEKNEFLFS